METMSIGRLVREEVMETRLKFEGMNYVEASRYVAMGYELIEIKEMHLEKIVPIRRYKFGSKPNVTGNQTLGPHSNNDELWIFPNREPTEGEKVRLIAACLEIGVRFAFSNHTYQFAGKTFHQQNGGPIGMRLTGACARIQMGVWGRKLRGILNRERIMLDLDACYVDDMRCVTDEIEKGWRWQKEESKFKYNDEWKKEDEESPESNEMRTSKELEKVMNSIFPNIQFEIEVPEQFSDGRLPTLDFSLWINEENILMYNYYEKPMSSPYCITEQSAMPESAKVASLSQDLVRRMQNTSEGLAQMNRNLVIEKYIKKLNISGYKKKEIKVIIEAGLKGYETKLSKSRRNNTGMHRDARSTIGSRYLKKLTAKTDWFKSKKKDDENKEENEIDERKEKKVRVNSRKSYKRKESNQNSAKDPVTIIFVPRTPGGELITKLRSAEEEISKVMGGEKVKFVEKTGRLIQSILHKSNPHAGEKCGRKACLVCSSSEEESKNGDCRWRSILYKTTCLECKRKEGKVVEYYGETSKTAYERGLNHLYDFLTEAEDSHMFKHQSEVHGDQEDPVEFSMTVLKKHMTAFRRQIHEAVIVEMKESSGILNSKGIYDRCSLPRLTVKFKDREINLENEIEKVRNRKSKREVNTETETERKDQPPLKKTRVAQNKNETEEEVGRPPPERKFRKVKPRKKVREENEKIEEKDLSVPPETGKQPALEKKESPKKVKKVQTIIEIFNQMNCRKLQESNIQTKLHPVFMTPTKKQFSSLKKRKNETPISPASKMVVKFKNKAQPSLSPAKHRRITKPSSAQLNSHSLAKPGNNFQSIRSYFQTIQKTAVIISPKIKVKVESQNSPADKGMPP